eukprot:3044207-Alexandrium_andersonii.AAC.1
MVKATHNRPTTRSFNICVPALESDGHVVRPALLDFLDGWRSAADLSQRWALTRWLSRFRWPRKWTSRAA